MDVCCSPGGFSEYVLECNTCRGVGLSLPMELGGHVVAIDYDNVATPDRLVGMRKVVVRRMLVSVSMHVVWVICACGGLFQRT